MLCREKKGAEQDSAYLTTCITVLFENKTKMQEQHEQK